MRDGGRLAAAITVLSDMEARHRPARLALKDWGEKARYAGAKDRAFVSGLVLDVLRKRRSMAWRMEEFTDRARVLAVVRFVWGWDVERISAAAADPHGPGPLTDTESARLVSLNALDNAPDAVRGDYPDWLIPHMERAFGARAASEGEALTDRAPIDLRANSLKAEPDRVLRALAPFDARLTLLTPTALRIDPPAASERAAAVETLPEYAKGWFEVQDLGSQAVTALAGEVAHHQVLDLCAGGGGKTLALAAAMKNTGQLFAYDTDARRLADTQRRARRAGVRNLQVRSPLRPDVLADLVEHMDLVFVDAPCTGSGVWRRHPDAKWRLSPVQLTKRIAEQDAALARAASFARLGGRLIYVTCSLFCEENEDRVAAFLAHHPQFTVEPAAGVADQFLTGEGFLRLTPLGAATDGFFAAVLRRSR